MIDTDTRQLRRNTEGFYTSGAGKVPCDHCAWSVDCSFKPVKACKAMMPAIPFTDEIGLRKIANTVRIGVAWTQRLKPLQIVALYNSKERVVFGYARVVGLFCGNIEGMLDTHAHANHIMLDRAPDRAPSELQAWLLRNYGPHIVHERTNLTAIYLLRERVSPTPPDLTGHEAYRPLEGGAPSPGQDPGDAAGLTPPGR